MMDFEKPKRILGGTLEEAPAPLTENSELGESAKRIESLETDIEAEAKILGENLKMLESHIDELPGAATLTEEIQAKIESIQKKYHEITKGLAALSGVMTTIGMTFTGLQFSDNLRLMTIYPDRAEALMQTAYEQLQSGTLVSAACGAGLFGVLYLVSKLDKKCEELNETKKLTEQHEATL